MPYEPNKHDPLRHLVVDTTKLHITNAGTERIKQIVEEGKYNLLMFPEGDLEKDLFSHHVSVDRLMDGTLQVVETDENLVRLLRWHHPHGHNLNQIPIWISTDERNAKQ